MHAWQLFMRNVCIRGSAECARGCMQTAGITVRLRRLLAYPSELAHLRMAHPQLTKMACSPRATGIDGKSSFDDACPHAQYAIVHVDAWVTVRRHQLHRRAHRQRARRHAAQYAVLIATAAVTHRGWVHRHRAIRLTSEGEGGCCKCGLAR
jgi:hypothetical protein